MFDARAFDRLRQAVGDDPADLAEIAGSFLEEAPTLIEAMVKSAAWQEIHAKQDWTNVLLTGDAFGAYVQEEFRRTEAVLKDLGLA